MSDIDRAESAHPAPRRRSTPAVADPALAATRRLIAQAEAQSLRIDPLEPTGDAETDSTLAYLAALMAQVRVGQVRDLMILRHDPSGLRNARFGGFAERPALITWTIDRLSNHWSGNTDGK